MLTAMTSEEVQSRSGLHLTLHPAVNISGCGKTCYVLLQSLNATPVWKVKWVRARTELLAEIHLLDRQILLRGNYRRNCKTEQTGTYPDEWENPR